MYCWSPRLSCVVMQRKLRRTEAVYEGTGVFQVCKWCRMVHQRALQRYVWPRLNFRRALPVIGIFRPPYAIWRTTVRSCSLWRECTVDILKHRPTTFARCWIGLLRGQWCLTTKAHSYIPKVSCKILCSVCRKLLGVDVFCICNVKFKFELILSLDGY